MSFAVLGVGGTIAAVGTLGGLGVGIAGLSQGKKAQKRAQRSLEERAENSPLYKPSKEISDYYQEALYRYKQSPLQSQEYLIGKGNIQGAMSSGLQALQDRRSAIGGISRLAGTGTNALRNLSAQAESRKGQDLNRLGQASSMKAGQLAQAFDINQMTPYNRQLQLEQMRAQAAGEQANAGMQMIGSALSNAASYGVASAYGQDGFGIKKGRKTNYNNSGMYQGNPNNILPYSDMV